jgi:DNA-binding HxlR family transcriptional regulator
MEDKPDAPLLCPMATLLQIMTGPWTMQIIWVLNAEGPARFGALKRRVGGISSRVLTERLRMLEDEKFVTRHYEPTVPPQVTYSPTERIQQLRSVLQPLSLLAAEWYSQK